MRRIIIVVSILCSLTGLLAQTDFDKAKETVSKSEIEAHIYFLADDLLKGRETGTPENKIAAAYLANEFRSYGVKPNPKSGDYYQSFALKKSNPPKNISVKLNGNEIGNVLSLSSASIDTNSEVVFLGHGLEADYKGKNVKGKIIVIKAGDPESSSVRAAFGLRGTKESLASEAGAIAVLEVMDVNKGMWNRLEHYIASPRLEVAAPEETDKKDELTYLWVQDKDWKLANTVMSAAGNAAVVVEPGENDMVMTQNVIGVVEGSDPVLKNEYIIYSAHYDHVGIGTPDSTGDNIYNGARDNAVGTTTVLSMAENLAKYPTKRSALFILFTAEEKGLLGSKYYVENPVLPLNQMVYCFNSDNGGYNDTSLATIIGLERTTAKENIKSAAKKFGLKAIEDPAPEQGLFDRSDNVHFAAKGIPAPTFSMGFSAFDAEINKYYHQPRDHADSIDYDYLLKFFRAYVLAGRNIGNDPITPVWVKGDKYEEAGNKLYQTER